MRNELITTLMRTACRGIGAVSELRVSARVLKPFINIYCRGVGVNRAEINWPAQGYDCFGDFFARKLVDGCRPLDSQKESAVFPCDGRLSAVHHIRPNRRAKLFVKGYYYDINRLSGAEVDGDFAEGGGLVVYLHPRDYHRVHMPMDGRLRRTIHIPGDRFPVMPIVERRVPGVFERNERLVFFFDTVNGPLVLIMVAAFGVGHMESPYAPPFGSAKCERLFDESVAVGRGQELGAFRLGSTVVLLWGRDVLSLRDDLQLGPVRFGEAMGRCG